MSGFRSVAFPLVGVLLLALPILLIGAASLMTLAFVRSTSSRRRAGTQAALATAGFAGLDALLLVALPQLGLSYGPVTFILVPMLSVRVILYVFWVGRLLQKVDRENGTEGHSYRPAEWLPYWLVNAVLTALLLYSFYIEPFNLQVTRVELHVPSAQVGRRIRIVQLSDTHVERTTRRERALVPLVSSLQPDLIVLTGDYLNLSFLEDPTAQRDARDLFAQLSAPYGIYAVSGSVDDDSRMQLLFSGTRVKILDDQVEKVRVPGGELALLGVSNWGTAHDRTALQRLASSAPQNELRLLLFHTPDMIQDAAQNGIDLYLAGHTHGGQIRLPWYGAIVTASIYGKEFEAGRYQIGKTTLYVSRGLGMEGGPAPRARFLAPPEVVVIDLVPTP